METLILVGAGIASYGVLTAMTPEPKQNVEPAPVPWNPQVDAKGTYSSQPIVGYRRDVDPQHGIPIVWQQLANGTERRVFLHRGEAVPQAPTYD